MCRNLTFNLLGNRVNSPNYDTPPYRYKQQGPSALTTIQVINFGNSVLAIGPDLCCHGYHNNGQVTVVIDSFHPETS